MDTPIYLHSYCIIYNMSEGIYMYDQYIILIIHTGDTLFIWDECPSVCLYFPPNVSLYLWLVILFLQVCFVMYGCLVSFESILALICSPAYCFVHSYFLVHPSVKPSAFCPLQPTVACFHFSRVDRYNLCNGCI